MKGAHRVLLLLLIPLMMIVSGCASFAKGITQAHVDYEDDERVIALMAKGLQPNAIAPLVQVRCTWLETVE